MPRSIHWGSVHLRLAAWYSVALAAALVLFGVLIRFSLERRLVGEIDEDLAGRAARFEDYYREQSAEKNPGHVLGELREFCAALPPGSFIELTSPGGLMFRYPETGVRDRDLRTIERRFSNAAGDRFEIVAGESMEPVNHTIAILRLQLIAMTPMAILLACFGGWLLSRRAMKPVADIANAAHAISIENLSMRLEVPKTGDELERLGSAFNMMLERLEAAVNTLSQFVADASHELRTPLSVIRASAEITLRRFRSGESYRESLAGIAAETEKMTALVEDLLFLARSDGAVISMSFARHDLRELAGEAARMLEHAAAARSVRVVSKEAEEPVFVEANRAALKRLFIALIDNAIKNSQEGGEVRIAVGGEGDSAVAAVRDFGRGISGEDLPHIFKRFYRADKSRTGRGYGLGLSIAESIARTHGAAIEVTSAPGEGATFTVTMPRRREYPAPEEFEAASQAS